jgi:hypothetical protein
LEDGDYSGYKRNLLDSVEKEAVLLRNDAEPGKASFGGRRKK